MKKTRITGILFFFFCITLSYSQEVGQPIDSLQKVKEVAALEEAKVVEKRVEKAEKKAAKEEKERKKLEKELKKDEKLYNAIASKKKSISKNEKKLAKLEEKLVSGEAKGKLSPLDVEKLNSKIIKMKAGLVKDNERLKKLLRKQ